MFPGRGIEGNHAIVGAGDKHHVVHDQRIERKTKGIARDWKEPRGFELRDVGFVDLGERGILHRVR